MAPTQIPLRLGSPEQFRALCELLKGSDYTENTICQRLGVASFMDFGSVRPGKQLTGELVTPLDTLVRLFLECEPVAKSKIESLLGPSAIGLLEALGLIGWVGDSKVQSVVGLCPVRSLYLVSDRAGDLSNLPEDIVYPAILENTQHFLSAIPATACRRFLDMGAGTGVAALIAAKGYADHAWACDITERSAHFMEFNRRLNGLENVTVARGDLYEPVKGQMFDRIVTHPPYVPAYERTCIFRDGGDDGEQIVRRIIEGLCGHLSPGGRFYALTLLSDREGEPVESRIRKWLGERQSEFDVVLIAETARQPADFVGRAMQKGTHHLDQLNYWSSVFRKLKVEFLVYGCVLIQRHLSDRPAFTVRLQKGPRSGIAETEQALAWQTEAAQPGFSKVLLRRPLAKSPHLHLAVLHRMRDGVLEPDEFLLKVSHPFESECKCQSWVVSLVENCDGVRNGLEILQRLKEMGAVHKETDEEEFAEILKALVSAGLLTA